MFSVNLKLTNKRLTAILLIFSLSVTVLVALRLETFAKREAPSVQCSTEDDVRKYVASFGIETGEYTVDSVTVPYEFGEVYSSYNKVQLSQGFDLSGFKGKTLKRYTFEVLEHPEGDNVFAEVLLFDKTVVGADVYSTALDGFIIPLK